MTIEQFGAFNLSAPRVDVKSGHDAEVQLLQQHLLQRASNGDSLALSQLYDVYAPGLHRVLTAILSSPDDAKDALQETFLRLLDGKMSRAQDVRAYLFTTARHVALDILRRRKRERNRAETLEASVENPNHDLQSLLQTLPIEQREVVALKVLQEMTFAEIALVVKASPNTVASRYRYGIEKLRRMLRDEEQSDE